MSLDGRSRQSSVSTRLQDHPDLPCPPVELSAQTLAVDEFERHRRELTGFCYRMLGSGFEADDAVQETMVRAWRAADRFEGRSTVRSWLYRIATNVCLDMLRGRERRARPMELGPSSPPDSSFLGPMLPEHAWVSPIADARVLPEDGDPAEIAAGRETIRLAFVTALQHLPSRQRAVLILCEVLRWQATEVAELLDTSVAAVNSALQRARATLASIPSDDRASIVDPEQCELLARYVDAFERYDISTLVSLLHDDAIQSMPPYDMWLEGRDDILTWFFGPGIGCQGSRVIPTMTANGSAAFGQYKPSENGGLEPWALQVVELRDGKIGELTFFLATETLFPLFGLPLEFEG
jgi:RNA polymerase sigma-70 factor, ECF subfamily